jgi:hypothetical protein
MVMQKTYFIFQYTLVYKELACSVSMFDTGTDATDGCEVLQGPSVGTVSNVMQYCKRFSMALIPQQKL